jgi:Uma2 family endonuclease
MATVNDPQTMTSSPIRPTARKAGPRRWRWTAEQFHQLSNAGFFRDSHVELVNGDLYELTVNPPHDTGVYETLSTLQRVFGVGYAVRPQMALDLGRRYQPLPDIAVVVGAGRDYATQHPTTAVLLVEVSDSSLRHDRKIKAHRYAQAGIADYWILNLIDRQLEVYRKPEPDPSRPGRYHYADVTMIPVNGQVSPLAQLNARIAVANLLP